MVFVYFFKSSSYYEYISETYISNLMSQETESLLGYKRVLNIRNEVQFSILFET